MSVLMIICMFGIAMCMYGIGYNSAMLKTAKAIDKALKDLHVDDDNLDFGRGAIWAIGHIQNTLM